MYYVLLVGIGGFIGSVFRYLLTNWIYNLFTYPIFPIGILIVNVVGCLLIGFLGGIVETRETFTTELRIFLMIGVLGGFTTFSSFGYDTFGLLRDGQFFLALANVLLQVIIGLSAVWLGYVCSRLL